jgi:hypothetical protein
MHSGFASVGPLASLKFILIPLGILGFMVFLLALGALALGLSMSLLAAISWLLRLPRRRFERRAGRLSGGAR